MLEVLKETKLKIRQYEDKIFLLKKENQNIKNLKNISQEEENVSFENV